MTFYFSFSFSSSFSIFFSNIFLFMFMILGSVSSNLVLPINKDHETLQYYTSFSIGTPKLQVNAVVNLAGDSLWLVCSGDSSSRRSVKCESDTCSFSNSRSCIGPKCSYNSFNPYLKMVIGEELSEDVLYVTPSHNVTNVSHVVVVPEFPFSCVESILVGGLANEARGMVGFSRNRLSLPEIFARSLKIPSKFAFCVPSSGVGNIFIGGGGPYFMSPFPKDMSKMLIRTPLLLNPISTSPIRVGNSPSDEYFINVTSIRIGRKRVRFNTSVLKPFRKDGSGGTKISTVVSYTTLRSSVYRSVIRYFVAVAKIWKMKKVKSVAPFNACYDSRKMSYKTTGPVVPPIDLVLQSSKVYWRIHGANSMVKVSENVMCLGFVDGGLEQLTPIVIGGYQLEDNLLQFDLGKSELRFSSSLLLYNTSCSHGGK